MGSEPQRFRDLARLHDLSGKVRNGGRVCPSGLRNKRQSWPLVEQARNSEMHPGLHPNFTMLGTKSSISSDALFPKEPNSIILKIKGTTHRQHGTRHLM